MTPSEFFVGLDGLPTLRNRLPTRVIGGMLFSLLIVLLLLLWMLSLSRGLERTDVAMREINNARVVANQIAIELIRPTPDQYVALRHSVTEQEQALMALENHGSSGVLWVSATPHIAKQLDTVINLWKQRVSVAIDEAKNTGNASHYLDVLSTFLSETDRLAGMVSIDKKKKRTLLRFLQGSIAFIGSVGTGLATYFLYVWFIQPMLRLRDGLQRLSRGNFDTRLVVNTRDEFGALAHGFNLMADKLERLYAELENGVRSKTAELEKQNREIACMYAIAAFLNMPNDSEEMCRGFLRRVIKELDALGATVRVNALPDESAHIVMTEGDVDTQKNVTQMLDSVTFDIVVRDEVIGTHTVYFSSTRHLSESEIKLLDTLGQHLGIALDNRRLEAKARKLAVTHERSLLAQGLHDSIAQGLNFLKMQLQLLEDAMQRNDQTEIPQFVELLRAGVDESYQDVRELLVNFRTKLDQVELPDAVEDVVGRFRRQTSIDVSIDTQYKRGHPLSPDQQLQVLFILQEALSNIRKHAKANEVRVVLRNEYDFELEITDNGLGYCVGDALKPNEEHIGLQIMRERAARLHAVLQLNSVLGVGTTVRLILPHSERSIV
jgi:two-component system nitrate/nitrite sensor histidine kinase NarX